MTAAPQKRPRRRPIYQIPRWGPGIRTEPTNVEMRIAIALVNGHSQREAVEIGGFAPSTARCKNHKIIRQPGVRAAILKFARLIANDHAASAYTASMLLPILDDPAASNPAAMPIHDLLTKLCNTLTLLRTLWKIEAEEAALAAARKREEARQYERLERRVQELAAARRAASTTHLDVPP